MEPIHSAAVPGEPIDLSRNLAAVGDDGSRYVPQTRSGVGTWIAYDFGRTLWSYSLVTAGTFSLWVTKDLGQNVAFYSIAYTLTLLVVAIASPALGVISDRAGRRKPFLAVVTAMIIGGTALIGLTDNLWLGILFFVIAGVGYQSTYVFYDSMLGSIAPPRIRGRISGFGMAAGYMGTVTWGALIILLLTGVLGEKNSAYFIPTALAVTLFVVPCFFFVREKPVGVRPPITRADIQQAFSQLLRSIRTIRGTQQNLWRYLLARLLYVDAANTAISFMAVYAGIVIGLNKVEINTFGILAATFAIFGALICGWLSDRFGPKRVLYIINALWFVVMVGAVVAPEGSIGKYLLYALGPVAGIALGGLRATDRAFLIRITPPPIVGEAFGLSSLIGDAASILGQACIIIATVPLTLLIAFFVGNSQAQTSNGALSVGHDVETLGYRIALVLITILLCCGWLLLHRVSDHFVARLPQAQSTK